MTASFKNPEDLAPPFGPYTHVVSVAAKELVFLSGQVGADAEGKIAESFEDQCKLMYANIEIALKSVGLTWADIVSFTSYLVEPDDIQKYMAYRRGAYAEFFPDGKLPSHTLLFVKQLVNPALLVEVTAVAART